MPVLAGRTRITCQRPGDPSYRSESVKSDGRLASRASSHTPRLVREDHGAHESDVDRQYRMLPRNSVNAVPRSRPRQAALPSTWAREAERRTSTMVALLDRTAQQIARSAVISSLDDEGRALPGCSRASRAATDEAGSDRGEQLAILLSGRHRYLASGRRQPPSNGIGSPSATLPRGSVAPSLAPHAWRRCDNDTCDEEGHGSRPHGKSSLGAGSLRQARAGRAG